MGKHDPQVDAYIASAAPFARPILTHLRKVVHKGCPDVEEAIKWRVPAFMYKGILCGMAAFKEHCTFGFWKSSLLEGAGNGGGDAMGQFGRITSLADLPSDAELLKMVRDAARLNEEGVKVPRVPKAAPRKPLPTPPALTKALRANAKARAAFEAFSPSHKREYVEWIGEAKTDETRQRRLATALEWMADGKPRNWKYMK